MDTLHTVLRAIRSETKERRDHLSVFREFLCHLERVGRRAARTAIPAKPRKPYSRGNGKRSTS
jgi:hypothetical protein